MPKIRTPITADGQHIVFLSLISGPTGNNKRKRDIMRDIQKVIAPKLIGSNHKMAPTIIAKCPKCGGYLLATQTQKTKICPYCGTHINLQKAQRIAAAKDAFEASEILRKLKAEKGFSN